MSLLDLHGNWLSSMLLLLGMHTQVSWRVLSPTAMTLEEQRCFHIIMFFSYIYLAFLVAWGYNSISNWNEYENPDYGSAFCATKWIMQVLLKWSDGTQWWNWHCSWWTSWPAPGPFTSSRACAAANQTERSTVHIWTQPSTSPHKMLRGEDQMRRIRTNSSLLITLMLKD